MNQIPKRTRHDDEIDRIRTIVGRHKMPDFVTGFDVRLGEFDGDPAFWVAFKIARQPTRDEMDHHVQQRSALLKAVQPDLLDEIEDRYPFFRFEQATLSGGT